MSKRKIVLVVLTLALGLFAMAGCASQVSFADLPEKMETTSSEYIDTSDAANGTIKAHAISDVKSKLYVVNGDNTQTYQLPEDGSEIVVPLNLGDGTYRVEVCEHRDGTQYEVKDKKVFNASNLGNKPYLSSNRLCEFTPESGLAQHASYLCESLTSDKDKMDAIVSWVVDNITYDMDKASNLANDYNYYPVARDTYNTKTGICFDYASLTAAMLRSQGIPTKVMTGTYTPTDVYHSWNEVLIDDNWVAVDTTRAATSDSDLFVDSSLYDIRYAY